MCICVCLCLCASVHVSVYKYNQSYPFINLGSMKKIITLTSLIKRMFTEFILNYVLIDDVNISISLINLKLTNGLCLFLAFYYILIDQFDWFVDYSNCLWLSFALSSSFSTMQYFVRSWKTSFLELLTRLAFFDLWRLSMDSTLSQVLRSWLRTGPWFLSRPLIRSAFNSTHFPSFTQVELEMEKILFPEMTLVLLMVND